MSSRQLRKQARRNGAKAAGTKSPAGIQQSSQNSLKHGLSGKPRSQETRQTGGAAIRRARREDAAELHRPRERHHEDQRRLDAGSTMRQPPSAAPPRSSSRMHSRSTGATRPAGVAARRHRAQSRPQTCRSLGRQWLSPRGQPRDVQGPRDRRPHCLRAQQTRLRQRKRRRTAGGACRIGAMICTAHNSRRSRCRPDPAVAPIGPAAELLEELPAAEWRLAAGS